MCVCTVHNYVQAHIIPRLSADGHPPPAPVERAAWRALLLAHNRAVRAIEADLDATEAIPSAGTTCCSSCRPSPTACACRTSATGPCSRAPGSAGWSTSSKRRPRRAPARPDDGRATLAAITPAGRAAFRATAPLYLAKIDEHFGRHLTARERQVVARALTKVVDAHTRLPHPAVKPQSGA